MALAAINELIDTFAFDLEINDDKQVTEIFVINDVLNIFLNYLPIYTLINFVISFPHLNYQKLRSNLQDIEIKNLPNHDIANYDSPNGDTGGSITLHKVETEQNININCNDDNILQYMINNYLTNTKKHWSKKHPDTRKVTDYQYNKRYQYIHVDAPDKNDVNYNQKQEVWNNKVIMNDVYFQKIRVCNAKQMLQLLLLIHPEHIKPIWCRSYWNHDEYSINYFNKKQNIPKEDWELEFQRNNSLPDMIQVMDTFGLNDALNFKDDIEWIQQRWKQRDRPPYEQDDEMHCKEKELNRKIFICLCYILFFNVIFGSISKDGGSQDDDKMMYLYRAHSTQSWLHRHDATYKWLYLFCCKNSNDTLSKLFVYFYDFYD